MSSDLDAIWAEMQEGDSKDRKEAKKRSRALGSGGMVGVTKLMKENNIKGYVAGSKKAKSKSSDDLSRIRRVSAPPSAKDKPRCLAPAPPLEEAPGAPLSSSDLISAVSRDVTVCETGSALDRKKALQRVYSALLNAGDTLSGSEYSDLFVDISKPLFKRFSDDVEKCRDLAFTISGLLFDRASNVLPILAYFLPALMKRIPPTGAYDDELKIFVVDIDAHEAFKRGRAVDRQDRGDALRTHVIVETSEEIRLLAVKCVATLVSKVVASDACSVLQPYFTELVVFIQSQLRDPFGDIRAVSCDVLCMMAVQPEFELGMKFYAVALVRALLPVLRHRHAKVRCAAVDAIKCCVMVPDRAKRKGAGTGAIQDLVGFQEENVLPVAAFYKAEVQINYMAEIVSDATAAVRERVAIMLSAFLSELEDRYDHQTRLLPYLLDLLTDEIAPVSSIALACLQTCGRQYEQEHQDEIIERRQYGVDGDSRMNLDKPLPAPFLSRPRLGIRLFVRGNTKRFLAALLNELTNWISKTRLKSCKLLKVVICLVEEHLAMESYSVLPMFVKALGFATTDKDTDLKALLLETIELLGRFMSPDIYIHFILPRLTGDVEVVQFGVDAPTRISVLEVMQQLISGTKPSQLPQHLPALVSALVDPYVIDPDSLSVRSAGLDLMLVLLRSVAGGVEAATTVSAVEAHFMSTGRLSSLHSSIRSMFCRLVTDLSEPTLAKRASDALVLLASLEGGKEAGLGNVNRKLLYLFNQHTASVISRMMNDGKSFEYYSSSELPDWLSTDNSTIQLFCNLLECPWSCVQGDLTATSAVLKHLCDAVRGATTASGARTSGSLSSTGEMKNLSVLMNAAIAAIRPIAAALSDPHGECSTVPSAYVYLCPENLPAGDRDNNDKIASVGHSLAMKNSSCGVELTPNSGNSFSLVASFVDTFVHNSVWAPHIGAPTETVESFLNSAFSLHRKRLVLTSLLLGIIDLAPVQFFDSQRVLPDIPDTAIWNEASSLCCMDRQKFMFHDAAVILQSVVAQALSPACPVDVRYRGLQLLDKILCCLLGPERVRKVEPFSKKSRVGDNLTDVAMLLSSSHDLLGLVPPLSTGDVIFPGPVIVPLILSALDDSCSTIQLHTASSLYMAIHFVVPDHSPDSVGGSVTPYSFTTVTNCLLMHVSRVLSQRKIVETDEDRDIVDLLDGVLRTIACFDASLFESILRSRIDAIIKRSEELGPSGAEKDVIEKLSELISHCDIISQLNASTKM